MENTNFILIQNGSLENIFKFVKASIYKDIVLGEIEIINNDEKIYCLFTEVNLDIFIYENENQNNVLTIEKDEINDRKYNIKKGFKIISDYGYLIKIIKKLNNYFLYIENMKYIKSLDIFLESSKTKAEGLEELDVSFLNDFKLKDKEELKEFYAKLKDAFSKINDVPQEKRKINVKNIKELIDYFEEYFEDYIAENEVEIIKGINYDNYYFPTNLNKNFNLIEKITNFFKTIYTDNQYHKGICITLKFTSNNNINYFITVIFDIIIGKILIKYNIKDNPTIIKLYLDDSFINSFEIGIDNFNVKEIEMETNSVRTPHMVIYNYLDSTNITVSDKIGRYGGVNTINKNRKKNNVE